MIGVHRQQQRRAPMMEPSGRIEEKLIVVVFCTGENRVVQITCSSSKIVLRTTKKNMMYLGSGPSLEVIAPCLVV
jgi:hypothetical protein